MITYNLSTEEKFEKMQQQMYLIYPSLGSFYNMCNKRALPKESKVTLRLNVCEGSAPIIEYTEDFMKTLSVETFTILMSIELFRLLLHHPTTRMQVSRSLTVQASNFICSDSKIRNFIMPAHLKDALIVLIV